MVSLVQTKERPNIYLFFFSVTRPTLIFILAIKLFLRLAKEKTRGKHHFPLKFEGIWSLFAYLMSKRSQITKKKNTKD